jgi:predicted Zn-dependent peptidase
LARLAAAIGAALAVTALPAARQAPALPSAQQSPDRSKPPVLGPPPALKLPPIEKHTLANGVPVWIVGMHEVPVVNISIVIRAGAGADPAGKFGVANFTASMLDEGAGARSALELADAIDFLGASLTTGSSFDASTVRLHTPVSKLDDALPLLADVALRPSFLEAELERLRKERLTSLLQTRDNPAALASAAFARLVYGPRHRYGTLAMGNDASNGEMSVADLKTFYATYYQPQHAHLLVAGDVRSAEMLPKLEKAFGGWKNATAAKPPEVPAATQHGARQIYLVDKPGAAQSQIRIGWVGVPRSSPDYYVLDVLNTVLGGSFSSRLNMNLREEHGYAYGAGSFFDMRRSAGPFLASAGVQSDKTVESLREFFKELEGIRAPIPGDELTRAKNLQALSFPGTFETTAGMAGNLIDLIVYNLPERFLTEYVAKIQAVTAADVQRAAAQYVQPDKFAVVVVGDLATIEKPVRAANLGPVRIVTADEILK